MKIFHALILLIILVPAVYASDSPAEIYHCFSINSLIPTVSNAYGVIPGPGYDFKVIKDAFLFMVSINTGVGAGGAMQDGTGLYGMYKNEWFVPAADIPGRTAVYLRGEAAASFGWNVSSFFERRQFIILTLSALFEREDIGGRVFSKLGRYSSCISISSEVFRLFGNTCLFTFGYGSVSFSDLAKPGTLAGFLKAGLSMDFKVTEEKEDIYKRLPQDKEGDKQEEGETVW